MDQPRGIRNNNPGNIRWGDAWQGLVPPAQRTDPDFCQFIAPAWGIRAIAITLITYQDKRRAPDGSPIDSVREVIERWAPAVENNTAAYVQAVASALSVGPDDTTVNVHDYATLLALVKAIIRHENGVPPKGDWYGAVTLDEGLKLAGVVKPAAPRALPSPITLALSTGGAAAATQALQQAQPVLSAIGQVANTTATWPQWLRLAGVALVFVSLGAAGVAWWRQHRVRQAVQP